MKTTFNFISNARIGYLVLVISTVGGFVLGCGGSDSDEVTTLSFPATSTEEAKTHYAAIVHASYEDSLTAAQTLDAALTALIATPTPETMATARQAWLASREPYLQTEVYRFYDGPIDNPDDGPEGLLNAWPLDENYIDYTVSEATAGLINDAAVTIEAGMLEALNEKDGEKNIATGYHAIEFLLWGQDTSDAGAGERPHTDYLTDGNGTATNQDRRGQYLTTASTMLIGHLQTVTDAWAPSGNNYRAEFEAADNAEAMRRILTGMIVLSGFETGGERLQTALDSGEQEDEHSCFSDNTHRDMVQDVVGVRNVWRGEYTRIDGSTVSGTGIKAVIEEADSDLASRLDAQINESVQLAEALLPPFDQEIKPGNAEGNARVQALIAALRNQETLLQKLFQRFALTVPVVE